VRLKEHRLPKELQQDVQPPCADRRRSPISRVRSVTDTSRLLMRLTPTTMSEIDATIASKDLQVGGRLHAQEHCCLIAGNHR
jgi:hypothetical protein